MSLLSSRREANLWLLWYGAPPSHYFYVFVISLLLWLVNYHHIIIGNMAIAPSKLAHHYSGLVDGRCFYNGRRTLVWPRLLDDTQYHTGKKSRSITITISYLINKTNEHQVTVNYRVGPAGFLTLGIEEVMLHHTIIITYVQ